MAAPVGTDPREDLTLIHIWAVAARRGEGWRLPGAAPLGLGSPKLSLGRWEETQPASRAGESLGRFGYKEGGVSVSISKTPAPRTCTCPCVAAEVDPGRVGSWLPSQGSPFIRAKPRAQAGSVGGAAGIGTASGSPSRPRSPVPPQLSLSMGTWAGPVATPGGPQEPTQGPPWCYPPHSACRAPQAAPPRGPHGVTHLAVLAGAPPGSPQGGAALSPQGGSAYVHLTAAILDLQPTGALGAVCRAGVTRSLGSPAGLTPAH